MSLTSEPASYIKLVQHLIEKCLLFHMEEGECIDALAKHASINPIVTRTVWRELEKVNEEFFTSYYRELQSNRDQIKNQEADLSELLRESSGIEQDDSCSSSCESL